MEFDMKILVAVKRVIDYQVKVRINPDGSDVETKNVKMSMNPFDEIAVEEAVRLKEKGHADEIIAVSIGADVCQETLRQALAMGADRALLVKTENSLEPLHIAKILNVIAEDEGVNLIILGKQAIDDDSNQVGQMLAGLLNWSQGTFVSALEIKENAAMVVREVDGGLETLTLELPSVITTDLRLNEPRFISLPNIMKAKRKKIDIKSLEDMNISLKNHSKIVELTPPTQRSAGIKVESINELMDKLKNQDKVLP